MYMYIVRMSVSHYKICLCSFYAIHIIITFKVCEMFYQYSTRNSAGNSSMITGVWQSLHACKCQSCTEAETACQKWGGSAIISGGLFTVILNGLIVFKYILCDSLQFRGGGAQPPLSRSGGAQAPPAHPGSLPLMHQMPLTC